MSKTGQSLEQKRARPLAERMREKGHARASGPPRYISLNNISMLYPLQTNMCTSSRSLGSILLLASICFSQHVSSQTIVQSANVVVPCCVGQDSLDIGLDGSHDVKVEWIGGIDNVQSYMFRLDTNYLLAYPVEQGDPYGPFWNHSLLTQTTIACFWTTAWEPNTGLRYVGFMRIDSPIDTTHGWIMADFYGDASSCEDTVAILQVAYNSSPNTPLPAGSVLTGIADVDDGRAIWFDATESTLVVDNRFSGPSSVEVWTSLGQKVLSASIGAGSQERFNMRTWAAGAYVAVQRGAWGSRSSRFVR